MPGKTSGLGPYLSNAVLGEWDVAAHTVAIEAYGSKPRAFVNAFTNPSAGPPVGSVDVIADDVVAVSGGKGGVHLFVSDPAGTIALGGKSQTGELKLMQGTNTVALETPGITVESKAGQVQVKGTRVVIEAVQGIELTVGPNRIVIDTQGIQIFGSKVAIAAMTQVTID